jgi:uncharacterized phage protein gp47/JayE
MAKINKVDDMQVIDYMARDYDSFKKKMIELIPEKLPDWTDRSEADFGIVLLELFAHMADTLSYYQDRIANESFLTTAKERRSVIQHLRLIGYRLSTAAPAAASLTVTVAADRNDLITIEKGDAFATKSEKDKPSVRFEYTRESPLEIDFSTIDPDETNTFKIFEGVPVEEGNLIEDEILGTSDGTPNQKFPLGQTGLILRSLGASQDINRDIIIISYLNGVPTEWKLQESLAFSRENQKDFMIEVDEEDRATIIFGDDSFGAIPPNDTIIKATYRVGGGLSGNVGASKIETIVDAPQLTAIAAEVTNPEPATGGADRESIEDAIFHAPRVFRSLKRSVTAEDYEALALEFNGVGKVRAESPHWNMVTLFVAPEGGGYVDDILESNLLAYFEDKRPLSTIIKIEDVTYVDIYVTAEVGVKSYYNPDEVKEQVQAAAANLLAFENVDFGECIYLSKFYEAIEDIEGVEYVFINEFKTTKQAEDVHPEGKISLKEGEIPKIPEDPEYIKGIKVEVLKEEI